jgi:hypothetical protein
MQAFSDSTRKGQSSRGKVALRNLLRKSWKNHPKQKSSYMEQTGAMLPGGPERFLDEHQIAYTWIDVDKDTEASKLVEKINKGFRSVPTIDLSGWQHSG